MEVDERLLHARETKGGHSVLGFRYLLPLDRVDSGDPAHSGLVELDRVGLSCRVGENRFKVSLCLLGGLQFSEKSCI